MPYLADPEKVTQAMELASASNSIEYLEKRTVHMLKTNKIEDPTLESQVKRYARTIKDMNQEHSGIWDGTLKEFCHTLSEQIFENFQVSLANQATEELKIDKNNQIIAFYYAVDDSLNFVRGYSMDDKPIEDQETIEALDTLFTAFITKNGMMSKDGVIFEYQFVDEATGDIEPTKKADRAKLETLLMNEFSPYAKEKFTLEVIKQEMPT